MHSDPFWRTCWWTPFSIEDLEGQPGENTEQYLGALGEDGEGAEVGRDGCSASLTTPKASSTFSLPNTANHLLFYKRQSEMKSSLLSPCPLPIRMTSGWYSCTTMPLWTLLSADWHLMARLACIPHFNTICHAGNLQEMWRRDPHPIGSRVPQCLNQLVQVKWQAILLPFLTWLKGFMRNLCIKCTEKLWPEPMLLCFSQLVILIFDTTAVWPPLHKELTSQLSPKLAKWLEIWSHKSV